MASLTVRPDAAGGAGSVLERRHPRRGTAANLVPIGLLLALFNLAVWSGGMLAARWYAAAFLLVVPGAVLLSCTRMRPAELSVRLAWSVGASAALLMLLGLLASAALPHLGDVRPLSAWTLAGMVDAVTASCALARSRRGDPLAYLVPARAPERHAVALAALLAALPLAAVWGAALLNNGAGSWLALAVLLVAGALLGALLLVAPRLPRWSLAAALYSASAATLLGLSMRSSRPFGFDIQSEYHFYTATLAAGAWHVSTSGNAYAAMLSITVLPAALSVVAHVSGVQIFKLVFPLFVAGFPVLAFTFAARWFSLRAALVGPLVLVAQGFYTAAIASLARQDLGLLFFALVVVTAFDESLAPRARAGGTLFAAAGMSVSHYSTAYFACLVLLGGYLVQMAMRALRRMRLAWDRRGLAAAVGTRPAVGTRLLRLVGRGPGSPANGAGSLLSVSVLVPVLALVYVWNVVITHSAANITNVVSSVRDEGLQILPATRGSSLIDRFLNADVTPSVSVPSFLSSASRFYRDNAPWIHPYPASVTAGYPVKAAHVTALTRDVPAALPSVLGHLGTVANEVLLMAIVVGTGYYAWSQRRDPRSARGQLAAVTLACVLVLGLLRTSATLSDLYNASRGQVQGMLVLSLGLASLCTALAGARSRHAERSRSPARSRRFPVVAAAASLGAVFLLFSNSGVNYYLAGGGNPVNLVNSGDAYQEYYFSDADIASATWLAHEAGACSCGITYADPYAGLQLIEVGAQRPSVMTLLPSVMEPGSWVYASTTNVVAGTTRATVAGVALTFEFPSRFLESVKNLVFTTGSTAVYR